MGGERAEHPALAGVEPTSAQHQARRRRSRDRRVLGADRPSSTSTSSAARAAEGVADELEQSAGRRTPHRGRVRLSIARVLGLVLGEHGPLPSTGSGVDDRRDRQRGDHEDEQRDEVAGAGDVEGVQRLGEPEVQREGAEHGGADGRPPTADEGAGDGEDEVGHRLEGEGRAASYATGVPRSAPAVPTTTSAQPAATRRGAERAAALLGAHPSIVAVGHPTCTRGRRSRSGSARRSTSRVTGATSPCPNSRNWRSCEDGLPSVHSK